MDSPMTIEYFPDGSADAPLILVYGYSKMGARILFHAIQTIKEDKEIEIPIHRLCGYSGINNLKLTFKVGELNEGIKQIGNLSFTCVLTPDGWDAVEFLLSPFWDRSAQPGHFQWLNKDGDISLLFSTYRGW